MKWLAVILSHQVNSFPIRKNKFSRSSLAKVEPVSYLTKLRVRTPSLKEEINSLRLNQLRRFLKLNYVCFKRNNK
jgi:hypothetical protein